MLQHNLFTTTFITSYVLIIICVQQLNGKIISREELNLLEIHREEADLDGGRLRRSTESSLVKPGDTSNKQEHKQDSKITPENASEEENSSEVSFFDKQIVLPKYYNKLEIPTQRNSDKWQKGKADEDDDDEDYNSVSISVGIIIRRVKDINELEETLTLDLDLVVNWFDMVILMGNDPFKVLDSLGSEGEFQTKFRTLDPEFLKQIWKPDLFIENVDTIGKPSLILQPVKLLFQPTTGQIIFAARITVKLDCGMDFSYYPADTQECFFKIRSYAHTNDELSLSWSDPKSVYIIDRNDDNYYLKVSHILKRNIEESFGALNRNLNETYDLLEFRIDARRKLSYQMIQTYLPSIFFIGITWLCFLIPSSMAEARIGVAMTTLLTLTAMFSSVRENTPVVSYVKAIDIWMVACIFFVFSTLFEFTILLFLGKLKVEEVEETNDEKSGKRNNEKCKALAEPVQPEEDGVFIRSGNPKTSSVQKRKLEFWIEKYAFLFFSTVFFSYKLIYWAWLLTASNYLSWDVDSEWNNELG